MHASDDPIADVPIVVCGSGAFHRSARMWMQRSSIAAVCGYSSLSIMFLSNDSHVELRRLRLHPGGDERREVLPGVAVEQDLVVDDLIRGLGQHLAVGDAPAGIGLVPRPGEERVDRQLVGFLSPAMIVSCHREPPRPWLVCGVSYTRRHAREQAQPYPRWPRATTRRRSSRTGPRHGWIGATSRPTPTSGKPPYCIVIPPPNVTGGCTWATPWAARSRTSDPPGPHAGVRGPVAPGHRPRRHRHAGGRGARAGARRAIDRRDLGREAFVERVWEWKEQYGGGIVEQIKRMGARATGAASASPWTRGSAHAVRVAFVRLYEADLIYRGERLVNWCPTRQTGLSDSEVEHEEVEGELVDVPLSAAPTGAGPSRSPRPASRRCWATPASPCTRPTSATATLVGTTVTHPFDGREIPIVADACTWTRSSARAR